MPPAICVRQLTKRFGTAVAVDGIDFSIGTGETVGLLGPNGAGKTTTVEILEGLQFQTSGEVEVLGRTWARHDSELRTRIGVQLQETHFVERNTVAETLSLFASFYPRPASVADALGWVRLEAKRKAWVAHLSGGQRQRLGLAAALIGRPEILFLDEPTTGLDPQSRQAIWDVVRRFRAEGRTVLLTTHYMEEAEALCDRVMIIDAGRLIAEGKPGDLVVRHGGRAAIELQTEPNLTGRAWESLPGVLAADLVDGLWTLAVRDLGEVLTAVVERVARQGARVVRLTTRNPTMGDVFLALTGRDLRDGGEPSTPSAEAP